MGARVFCLSLVHSRTLPLALALCSRSASVNKHSLVALSCAQAAPHLKWPLPISRTRTSVHLLLALSLSLQTPLLVLLPPRKGPINSKLSTLRAPTLPLGHPSMFRLSSALLGRRQQIRARNQPHRSTNGRQSRRMEIDPFTAANGVSFTPFHSVLIQSQFGNNNDK